MAATAATNKPTDLTQDQVVQLGVLRRAFEELTEAYDAMRRMVERGYLSYRARARRRNGRNCHGLAS